MGATIVWNSCVLKITNIALFNITLSVTVSLRLYQITFTNYTYYKIAEDEQNSLITKFFTHILLKENQSNILDGLLTF
jgi:hypothetical protein